MILGPVANELAFISERKLFAAQRAFILFLGKIKTPRMKTKNGTTIQCGSRFSSILKDKVNGEVKRGEIYAFNWHAPPGAITPWLHPGWEATLQEGSWGDAGASQKMSQQHVLWINTTWREYVPSVLHTSTPFKKSGPHKKKLILCRNKQHLLIQNQF